MQRLPPNSGRMGKESPQAEKRLSLKWATKKCWLFSNIVLLNELESVAASFITHVQTCLVTSQLDEY